LVYTFDQLNTGLYTMSFINGLALLLASNMAIDITGRMSAQEKMLQYGLAALAQAASKDSNEHVARPPRDAVTIRARR